jgi:hypothetical protein
MKGRQHHQLFKNECENGFGLFDTVMNRTTRTTTESFCFCHFLFFLQLRRDYGCWNFNVAHKNKAPKSAET